MILISGILQIVNKGVKGEKEEDVKGVLAPYDP